jgi:CheY-like chemotaxis protein
LGVKQAAAGARGGPRVRRRAGRRRAAAGQLPGADLVPRILLIEDDADDHLIVRDLLSGDDAPGFDLDWVADYDEGLKSLLAGDYDACLLDLKFGLDCGVELLRAAAAAGCTTPMIGLSGAGSGQRAGRSRRDGGRRRLLPREGQSQHRAARARDPLRAEPPAPAGRDRRPAGAGRRQRRRARRGSCWSTTTRTTTS